MKRFLLPLGVLAGLLGLLGAGLGKDPQALPSPLIGKPAPAFSLARLDKPDEVFTPQALRGQAWVLNVWASWCGPCRQEHPLIVKLAQQGGVPIVGLNYMDKTEAGQQFLAEHGNPFHAAVQDPRGRTGIDYGVVGVPETFVIDKQGVVRLKLTGPLTEDALNKQVLPLLKELRRG
jgi:cytochrome c biogenesis protein CcmG/thiol:disulfide interchange protein DsbE